MRQVRIHRAARGRVEPVQAHRARDHAADPAVGLPDVDVTEPKPNVFYELGIAEGLRKEIILVAKAGTVLPFDINDFPVIFWDSFSDFEEELERR